MKGEIDSPSTSGEKADWKVKLEESLDRNFPKGECHERGPALVFYAETVLLIRSLLQRTPYEKIEVKTEHNFVEG